MASLFIRGGRKLSGEVWISGSKNAVLPMIAASVCFRQPCRIDGCPYLTDVEAALEILSHLGARWHREGRTIEVDPRPISRWDIPDGLMGRMRGSVFFAGPLIARFGACRLSQPGGCPLGERPVDFHIRGLEALGAAGDENGIFRGKLRGTVIRLPYPSVGATENLLMAALGAEGTTRIENAAREPEIQCLCDFLRAGGCKIHGDGSDTIIIRGGLPQSGEHTVIPDRMEAATYACAAACAGGDVTLKNGIHSHLTPVLDVLEAAQCRIDRGADRIRIRAGQLRSPGTIVTGPYPAFPTDAQAPVMAALLRAQGETRVRETVFSGRMNHIPGLRAIGAQIECQDREAVIHGTGRLRGAVTAATDLRGGAALMIAALAATGETEIQNLHHLLRGYEDPVGKLRALGADVSTA